jgi:hypothetical protein
MPFNTGSEDSKGVSRVDDAASNICQVIIATGARHFIACLSAQEVRMQKSRRGSMMRREAVSARPSETAAFAGGGVGNTFAAAAATAVPSAAAVAAAAAADAAGGMPFAELEVCTDG